MKVYRALCFVLATWTVDALDDSLELLQKTLVVQKHPQKENQANDYAKISIAEKKNENSAYLGPPLDSKVLDEPRENEKPAPVQVDKTNLCASVIVKLKTKDSKPTVKVSEKCAADGWSLDTAGQAECDTDGDKFPKTCRFPTIMADLPLEKVAKTFPVMSLVEMQEKVNHTFEMSKLKPRFGITARKKGKRDRQYQWAAKALKIEMSVPDSCKPATRGKARPTPISCRTCKLFGWIPYVCDCGCPAGYAKNAVSEKTGVTFMCYEPCTNHGEHSSDSGFYCHKPCERQGQIQLTQWCGGGNSRICVTNRAACATNFFSKVMSIAEVIVNVASMGAYKAISGAAKAAKMGVKAGMMALKTAMRVTAKALVAKLLKRGVIIKKMKDIAKEHADDIMEGGAELFLAKGMGEKTSGMEVLWEIAQTLDPTGLTGVIDNFLPPTGCDESAYFDEDMPPEDPLLPDLKVVDPCRMTDAMSIKECIAAVKSKWSAQPGECLNSQFYTKCKFAQSLGWHKEMATGSRGLAAARDFCMKDAIEYGAAGAQSALLWNWQYCFMFFEGDSCPDSAKSTEKGFYAEDKRSGSSETENLKFGEDESNYNYCQIGPDDQKKATRRRRSARRRSRRRRR